MGELQTVRCNKCRQTIVFIRTEKGSAMPCDAAPIRYKASPIGRQRLLTRYGKMVQCDTDCDLSDFDGWGYLPHWANCLSKDGVERMLGRKPETKPAKTTAPAAPTRKKRDKPVKDAPKFEQCCLWQSERQYIHPD
ncbi:MAG: hypothetical protein RR394_08380 [Oscillospiraceae bacterium]